MEFKPIIVIVLLVAVGGGAAVMGGDLFLGGSDETTEPFPTETPTATPTSGSGGGSDGGSATATATPRPPFGFVIENIEKCGTTCRDVTSTLINQQDETATDITVYTRIFVGRGTDGDVVWRGQADVGTLAPGESYTTTRRVKLSYSEALAVRNHDGWITVQTTVETAEQTVTFTSQRQVA